MVPEFRNEPFTDFSVAANQRRMTDALEALRQAGPVDRPLVINGERITTGEWLEVRNPADLGQTLGRVASATVDHADQALEVATRTFETWSRTSAEERACYLFKVAAIMRRRRFELNAIVVEEAGKTWAEADGDVAEGIDFLDFYAHEMRRLGGPQPLTRLPGEDNELYYIPLGPGVVIPPWNFPLAIPAGMAAAAIVAGNTVILKPAEQTSLTAWKILECFEEAGLPNGVLTFLPGVGEVVGEALVSDPRTRFISFTGSRAVGCRISEHAGRVVKGQRWLKRAILEMGGKDAIIVDASADIEAAVAGLAASVFGFSGQKCSACSRAIIHADVYDEVVAGLTQKAVALRVGAPRDPEVQMGPVIDEAARKKILSYIEIGREEGRVLCGGGQAEGNGWYVEPTVIADVAPDARVAQEEIFGPVVTCIKARDFDHAIEIANGTDYGLTGAVYSRNRSNLEQARREFHVGNLYFNRKCTGALVGSQPFGGFNMSGTDSKAGGRDYLLLLTQAKLVCEKL